METESLLSEGFRSLVKEGLLYKRGEKIRNWRPRYFYLFDDGSLQGFKAKANKSDETPLNNFTVQGCQIMKTDRPKPFTFILRGLQWTREVAVERMFCVDTEAEREDWINAIEYVAHGQVVGLGQGQGHGHGQRYFQTSNPMAPSIPIDIDIDDHFPQKFEVQGTVYNKLGKKKVTFENFEFIKVLGKGTFGKVVLCRDKKSKRLFAVKIVKKDMVVKTDEIDHTLTENRVLQTTSHPFLISLKCSFQTGDRLCFVTEYVNGGELYFHLANEKIFSEDKTRFYGAEIISAIGYLHRNGIIYRDIKLENLLLDKDGHIKIADFGLCKADISFGGTTKTFCGTPEYMAPELLECKSYGLAVDWWAVGVVMFEMMGGRLPFYHRDQNTLYDLILSQQVKFPVHLSPHAKDLLGGLLRKNPYDRLGGGHDDAKEIMEHPFFRCINWTDLNLRKIQPPFKPQVTSEIDTRYFDSAFTGESVELTPPEQNLLSSIPERGVFDFKDFSYRDMSTTFSSSVRSNGPLY